METLTKEISKKECNMVKEPIIILMDHLIKVIGHLEKEKEQEHSLPMVSYIQANGQIV